jgi:cyclopropane-fatty-acyl-phospholipid synthase
MSMEQVQTHPPLSGVNDTVAGRWLRSVFGRLDRGTLALSVGGGKPQVYQGALPGPAAALRLHRPWRLAARLLARGDVGFAEGYVAGDWDSPGLADLVTLLALNEDRFGRPGQGSMLARAIDRAQHALRRNDRRGSRRNIAFHYDLGNDFYRLWLDPGMTYSAAVFAHPAEPLLEAQERKYAQVLERLGAGPGDHILEIGCGWGGFAEHAASRGFRVTGITLSREQLDHAARRIAAAGLSDRVELRLQDYRDLSEQFDHVVSIEMFEAVGEAYWADYFATVHRCLRPGGRASLQIITIDAARFDHYRSSADFIQKYIFPGGMLPSVPAFDAAARAAGLQVGEPAFFGADYARTLERWNQGFVRARGEVARLGFDERFVRMWRYYLAYCEAGFRTGRIDLMQVALERPAG